MSNEHTITQDQESLRHVGEVRPGQLLTAIQAALVYRWREWSSIKLACLACFDVWRCCRVKQTSYWVAARYSHSPGLLESSATSQLRPDKCRRLIFHCTSPISAKLTSLSSSRSSSSISGQPPHGVAPISSMTARLSTAVLPILGCFFTRNITLSTTVRWSPNTWCILLLIIRICCSSWPQCQRSCYLPNASLPLITNTNASSCYSNGVFSVLSTH